MGMMEKWKALKRGTKISTAFGVAGVVVGAVAPVLPALGTGIAFFVTSAVVMVSRAVKKKRAK